MFAEIFDSLNLEIVLLCILSSFEILATLVWYLIFDIIKIFKKIQNNIKTPEIKMNEKHTTDANETNTPCDPSDLLFFVRVD